jgi:hypothetical protein
VFAGSQEGASSMNSLWCEAGEEPIRFRFVYPVVRIVSDGTDIGLWLGIAVILFCGFCLFHFVERRKL